MPTVRPHGTACAWVDGEEWRYTSAQEQAPSDAHEIKLLCIEGKIVLWLDYGQSGEFVYGAIEVR